MVNQPIETNRKEIMGWESSGVVGFDFGPLVQGQIRTAKLKKVLSGLVVSKFGI